MSYAIIISRNYDVMFLAEVEIMRERGVHFEIKIQKVLIDQNESPSFPGETKVLHFLQVKSSKEDVIKEALQ